jgi:hypothetical protein
MIRTWLVLTAGIAASSLALATAPADYPSTTQVLQVPSEGDSAIAPASREVLLKKVLAEGARRNGCVSIEHVTRRALAPDYVLPVARETTARELWVVRQCDVDQDYVVTLRAAPAQDELHIWPAGTSAPSGVVAPLPAVTLPSEAEARVAYDAYKASHGNEYLVRHILVPTREAAQAALDRIHHGEAFAKVAQELSIDTGSAARGGNLDWASDRVYIGPFAAELRALAPKGLAAQPVQTVFGWHVIEVLDVREKPLPPFDSVKDKLRQNLQKRLSDGL